MTMPIQPRLRVLIVDESPAARRQLGANIVDLPELSIVGVAGDAATAIDLFLHHRPDVVLVSICLPDQNGFELLQRLKQAEPHCTVILLTKHPNPSIELSSQLLGATAIVAKSSAFDGLREILLSLLKEKIAGQIPLASEGAAN